MTAPAPATRSTKARASKAAPAAAGAVEAPSNLEEAGRSLWLALTADTDFSPVELVVLAAGCSQADDIARLEAAIRSDGVIVSGSTGQARLSACVTEVRQGRLALAKLLDQLAIPDDDEEVGLTPAARRAKHAADTRWRRLTVAKEAGRGPA